jgi:hypothetical protein
VAGPSRDESTRKQPRRTEWKVCGPRRMQGVGINFNPNFRPLRRNKWCCRVSICSHIDFVKSLSEMLSRSLSVACLCPQRLFTLFVSGRKRNPQRNNRLQKFKTVIYTFSYRIHKKLNPSPECLCDSVWDDWMLTFLTLTSHSRNAALETYRQPAEFGFNLEIHLLYTTKVCFNIKSQTYTLYTEVMFQSV